MKLFTLILFTLFSTCVFATNYYISSTGSNNNDGLSPAKPWQTLSKLEAVAASAAIKSGDSILFKRGDTFTGTIKWTTVDGVAFQTGFANHPIVFSAYGTGEKPVFLFPRDNNAKAEDRILMWFIGVDYVIIDGLKFTDDDTSNDKKTPANCGVPLYFGAMDIAKSNHCTVKNVDISLCGMGVVFIGDFNTVTNSTLTKFKNLKSTPNTGGATAYEDYGANAVTITGNDNEVSYNYISDAWAESLDFGWNGGAIEMYNTCKRNKIIHNTIVDCGGVAEFGGQEKNGEASDNLFAYNMITNCGTLTYCNLSGAFTINVSNVQYMNNNITENNKSRFSGPGTGNGINTPGPKELIKPDKELFAYNGDAKAKTVFNIQDNIFNLSTGIAVARKSNDTNKYVHEHNVYKLSGGSETNFELNFSERLTNK